MSDYKILTKISSPADVKNLNADERVKLAGEMRQAILNRVSKLGGHVGPNLGMVEVAIALHTVFNSPEDKIVYDVSHQSYPHKLLTGRAQAFYDDVHFGDVSGYTNPEESAHDHFVVGHTSTSVSLAAGLAKARDFQGGKYNVIAVIGDGSLSGGEAFEGLDNAGTFKSNFIVIINDNEMSIAENHGGLYGNLAELRRTNGQSKDNYFTALGFDYRYIAEGNDSGVLIEELQKVKDIDHPVVLHIHTLKGKGYQPAEENKELFHWSVPFNLKTGKVASAGSKVKTYSELVADYLSEKAKDDPRLAVINAATPGALALKTFREEHSDRYFDVGIAEEHAVAFASGLAKAGMKPVAAFFSSFVQRTYDQLSQDVAINNTPVVFVVENTGISGMDATHLGIFDLAMMSSIPNLVCLSPADNYELKRMLEWAMEQTDFPVVIRTPAGTPEALRYHPRAEIKLGEAEIVKKGAKIALLGLGKMLKLAELVSDNLKAKGIEATIVNPRFSSSLDEALLTELVEDHQIFVTFEDGVVAGGWGQQVTSFLSGKGVKVYNFGAGKEFTDRVPAEELYRRYELTPEQIVAKIL